MINRAFPTCCNYKKVNTAIIVNQYLKNTVDVCAVLKMEMLLVKMAKPDMSKTRGCADMWAAKTDKNK